MNFFYFFNFQIIDLCPILSPASLIYTLFPELFPLYKVILESLFWNVLQYLWRICFCYQLCQSGVLSGTGVVRLRENSHMIFPIKLAKWQGWLNRSIVIVIGLWVVSPLTVDCVTLRYKRTTSLKCFHFGHEYPLPTYCDDLIFPNPRIPFLSFVTMFCHQSWAYSRSCR